MSAPGALLRSWLWLFAPALAICLLANLSCGSRSLKPLSLALHPDLYYATAQSLRFEEQVWQLDVPVVFVKKAAQAKALPVLMLQHPDGRLIELSKGFYAAQDSSISFDGKKLLFSAQATASDHWQIYEIDLESLALRQVVKDQQNCLEPLYQSSLYVISSKEPWQQVAFVGDKPGYPALFSSRLDGSEIRQLSYNPHGVLSPYLLDDGMMLFSAWQRERELGPDLLSLFVINLDGTDYSAFVAKQGKAHKHSATVTSHGLLVFVESDQFNANGKGQLGAVQMQRNFHSYRPLSQASDGHFSSPAALSDGSLLVSWSQDKNGAQGLYRYQPQNGVLQPVLSIANHHVLQAKPLVARKPPDGRSSVVNEDYNTSKLYLLNFHESDLSPQDKQSLQAAKRVRVLQAVNKSPEQSDRLAVETELLGEVELEKDGSLQIELAPNHPVKLQAVDAQGEVLRSCGWIWTRNHENRGCIGCHENPELSPENMMADALWKEAVPLFPSTTQMKTEKVREKEADKP